MLVTYGGENPFKLFVLDHTCVCEMLAIVTEYIFVNGHIFLCFVRLAICSRTGGHILEHLTDGPVSPKHHFIHTALLTLTLVNSILVCVCHCIFGHYIHMI